MNRTEYNKMVDLYADDLYSFLLKSLGNEQLSKDIVQDAFEKVWIKLEKVEFNKAKSYLFSTAYHKMIDIFRKNKLHKEFQKSNFEMSHSSQYSDIQDILHQAISLLSEKQRSVVLLRDYEGYSYEEIAEITDLSLSQVKVYIYRARVFLKNYIGSLEAVI